MPDLSELIPEQIKDLFSDDDSRMYITAGIMGAVTLAIITLLMIPQISELSRAAKAVKGLNDNITLVNNRVKQIEQKAKELNNLKAELLSYSKGLPGEREIPRFLEDLSAVAKKAGVKILSITPSETAKEKEAVGNDKEYYRELPIKITAKSGFHQLGRFISNLENGERYVTIEGLKIKHDEKMPRNHDVRLVLKTYVSVDD